MPYSPGQLCAVVDEVPSTLVVPETDKQPLVNTLAPFRTVRLVKVDTPT